MHALLSFCLSIRGLYNTYPPLMFGVRIRYELNGRSRFAPLVPRDNIHIFLPSYDSEIFVLASGAALVGTDRVWFWWNIKLSRIPEECDLKSGWIPNIILDLFKYELQI